MVVKERKRRSTRRKKSDLDYSRKENIILLLFFVGNEYSKVIFCFFNKQKLLSAFELLAE